MTDSDVQRLSSAELEDLAFVILSARPDGAGLGLYPDIANDVRPRLRSRIKQLSRYDWPSSLAEDPSFRRGWTLRQCCRLVVALLMLDAHLPPSLVVLLARNNEVGLLRSVAERLGDAARVEASDDDLITVFLPGEIRDALELSGWTALEAGRVRFVRRGDLARTWTTDLSGPGARILIDLPTAVFALWRWISGRRLMDDTARLALLAEIDILRCEPAYSEIGTVAFRRDREPRS